MNTFSGVTILLSLTVFSQVLADTMPATSDAIPLLGKSCQTYYWEVLQLLLLHTTTFLCSATTFYMDVNNIIYLKKAEEINRCEN